MEIIFSIILFIFGLIIGSFLNVVILRLKTGDNIVNARSHCVRCKYTLPWYDLIPLVSFIQLKRKCRSCKGAIAWQYPVVELATGLLFVAMVRLALPDFLLAGYWLLLACFFIVIFVYDLKHFIIPDKVIYPAIGVAFAYNVYQHEAFLQALLAGVAASAFFLLIVLVSRGAWMGLGDVKLALLMGLFLGFPAIVVALFLAFLIGAIIGIGLIVAHKKTMKSEVPFGPFLILGTFLALFWGQEIILWYVSFLYVV